jgi:hypothetical protein
MATLYSATNSITFTAAGDTARLGLKLRLAGVCVASVSGTAVAVAQLMNGTSTLQLTPKMVAKSGAGLMLDMEFNCSVETVGLKAANCTNAQITVYLR